ncbi:hypothetical protein [Paenibacillus sp. 1P07SE]|uniref:hypothetical protein n=1 Tax=Paenibacillus sp. 1P07SE TaxID=3132209 RepID=UPI0039A6D687
MNEMKDNGSKGPTIPKTYRARPEVITKLEELMGSSGLPTQADFLEYVAGIVEMSQLKEGVALGYRKLLEEREYHLRRDQEILMTIIQTEAAERLDLTQGFEGKLEERNQGFLVQEQTIAEQKEELKQAVEEKERLAKELTEQAKQVAQLEAIRQKNDLLLSQYEEKNHSLSEQLTGYGEAMEENKALRHQVDELTRSAEKQTERLAALEQAHEREQQQHAEQVAQLVARHEEALKSQRERLDVQRERELVQLRSEYQSKQEAASAEAARKAQDASDKIAALYETINGLREGVQSQQTKRTTKRNNNQE